MNTPVFDFVKKYSEKNPTRLHMPGHKGKNSYFFEEFDVTEIDGADVLYHETGILRESQENAALLFGSQRTVYSTEGSTLAIRTMLALVVRYAKETNKEPIILAGRNAHKSFLTSCALLDLDPIWLEGEEKQNLLSFSISANSIDELFKSSSSLPTALYLTSPDYLGNLLDIREISKVCKKYGVLLLIDNAHGAYLHFLPESYHPICLGADLCCDSAHKTLPVLTGGAYLHVSKNAPSFFTENVPSTMALFASTSPSYLILSSLDQCNAYLCDTYSKDLILICEKIEALKKFLKRSGFSLIGTEPLKITIQTKFSGYLGTELASLMRNENIECEFSDNDHVVLMLSPSNSENDLNKTKAFFENLPIRNPILSFPPPIYNGEKKMSIRSALFSPSEVIPVELAEGRILADPCVTCPPAIPIGICGESITSSTIQSFLYYGIEKVRVIKEK